MKQIERDLLTLGFLLNMGVEIELSEHDKKMFDSYFKSEQEFNDKLEEFKKDLKKRISKAKVPKNGFKSN